MNFASVLASRLGLRSPSAHLSGFRDESASIASSEDCSTSFSSESSSLSASLGSRSCTSEPACSDPTVIRRNEHLAVLLSKRLWKPDRQASRCDVFLCRKRFTLWERKHHCRKCGGVVCGDCSTRTTTLLDTSNLNFCHPPRDTPISAFDSPTSPVVFSRVCDHCWDQIHGVRTPQPLRHSESSASSVTSSVSTPSDGYPPMAHPTLRRAHTTSPRMLSSPLCSPIQSSQALGDAHISDSELTSNANDLGELAAYPLRRASIICKANGGGRWEPKQPINLIGHRLPGEKAPYEIELEREEQERKRWKANPVIKDGDIQVRVPREFEPHSPAGPIQFSTF